MRYGGSRASRERAHACICGNNAYLPRRRGVHGSVEPHPDVFVRGRIDHVGCGVRRAPTTGTGDQVSLERGPIKANTTVNGRILLGENLNGIDESFRELARHAFPDNHY